MLLLLLKIYIRETFCIKDIVSRVIHSYPHACPLHTIVKDIVYMQAQRGRAGITRIPLKEIFQNNLSITSI